MSGVHRQKAFLGLILSQNTKKQGDWCKGVNNCQGCRDRGVCNARCSKEASLYWINDDNGLTDLSVILFMLCYCFFYVKSS